MLPITWLWALEAISRRRVRGGGSGATSPRRNCNCKHHRVPLRRGRMSGCPQVPLNSPVKPVIGTPARWDIPAPCGRPTGAEHIIRFCLKVALLRSSERSRSRVLRIVGTIDQTDVLRKRPSFVAWGTVTQGPNVIPLVGGTASPKCLDSGQFAERSEGLDRTPGRQSFSLFMLGLPNAHGISCVGFESRPSSSAVVPVTTIVLIRSCL